MGIHNVYVIYKDKKPFKSQDSRKKRRAAYETKGAAKAVVTEEVKHAALQGAKAQGVKYGDPGYGLLLEVLENAERAKYLVLEYGPLGVIE